MTSTGRGLLVAAATGLAAGFALFLLLHPGFVAASSTNILELLPWTKRALIFPSSNELNRAHLHLWNHPALAAAAMAGIFLVLAASYGMALGSIRKGTCPSLGVILAAFLLFSIPLAATAPVLSADLFAYLAIGEIADRGDNPYSTVIADQDGIEARAFGPRARHESIYGPLATRLFQWSHIHHLALLPQVLLLRGLALVALPLSACMLAAAMRARSGNRFEGNASALVLLWNPLVLLESIVSVHVDLVILVLTTAALLLITRGRALSGIAALGTTAAVKLTTAFTLPSAWAYLWNQRGRGVAGLAAAGAAMLSAVVLFFVWMIPDWIGKNPLAGLERTSHLTGGSLTALLREGARAAGLPGLWALVAMRVAFAVVVLAGLTRVRTREDFFRRLSRDWLFYLLFFMPWMHPWYLVGAFPAVILSRSRAHLATLLLFATTYPTVYYGAELLRIPAKSALIGTLAIGFLPAAVLFFILSASPAADTFLVSPPLPPARLRFHQ